MKVNKLETAEVAGADIRVLLDPKGYNIFQMTYYSQINTYGIVLKTNSLWNYTLLYKNVPMFLRVKNSSFTRGISRQNQICNEFTDLWCG